MFIILFLFLGAPFAMKALQRQDENLIAEFVMQTRMAYSPLPSDIERWRDMGFISAMWDQARKNPDLTDQLRFFVCNKGREMSIFIMTFGASTRTF